MARFLKKFWRLYENIVDEVPTKEELKVLHQTIKKITDDIERFSFNTAVSNFMICTNDLLALNCAKREVVGPIVILMAPFAPHIAEELWHKLNPGASSVFDEQWPVCDESVLVESSFEYPVSFNGKMRFKLNLPLTATSDDAMQAVVNAPEAQRWIEGKAVKKLVFVPKKIINVVI